MATALVAPEPEISAPGPQGPAVDELLKPGKRSQMPRTVKLAEKIALMVHDLRGRLADERRAAEERREAEQEKEQARADVERLTREVAAATGASTAPLPNTPTAGSRPRCRASGRMGQGARLPAGLVMTPSQFCERCGAPTPALTGSYFNAEMICMECFEREQAHPDYERTRRADAHE